MHSKKERKQKMQNDVDDANFEQDCAKLEEFIFDEKTDQNQYLSWLESQSNGIKNAALHLENLKKEKNLRTLEDYRKLMDDSKEKGIALMRKALKQSLEN